MNGAAAIIAPREAAWLVDLIGVGPTLALIAARGGTRVQIPRSEAACNGSILADIVGLDALRAIARGYGGLYIAVPTVRAWRAALLLAAGGMSHAEVALRVGLTEKHVQRLASVGYQPMPVTHNGARAKIAREDDQPMLPFDVAS
jgi:hypothetical protein